MASVTQNFMKLFRGSSGSPADAPQIPAAIGTDWLIPTSLPEMPQQRVVGR